MDQLIQLLILEFVNVRYAVVLETNFVFSLIKRSGKFSISFG